MGVSLRRLMTTAAFGVGAFAPAGALAQGTAPVSLPPGQAPLVEEVVVTATAGGEAIRKQDAAFALTTIDDSKIEQLAPTSTADVLRAVPGVWVESSGGQNGANIFVRGFPGGGDAEFVTFQIEGSPVFPPPTLSFLENSQLLRFDEMVGRLEAVRGGPAQIFSTGQPGLTVNVIQKKGGPVMEGVAKGSIVDNGDWRVDGQVGGPLAPNTFYSVGGFYHEGEGVRSAGFEIEQGGQISGNVRHVLERGEVLVYGRYLNDSGAWLLPIPVRQDGDDISSYPGFDIGEGTFNSEETRVGVLNDGTVVDQSNGRGADLVHFGTTFTYDLTDMLRFDVRASYLNGEANTTGLVPAGVPTTASAIASRFGGTVGSLTYEFGGAVPPDPNMPVMEVGAWRVLKDIESLVGEFSLTADFGAHQLTGGVYLADFSSRDRWNLGNWMLLTAQSNPRVLNLVLADGRPVTRDGFTRGATFKVNADYEGQDTAVYLSDQWQVNEQLRLDAGVRWVRHEVEGRLENLTNNVDLDNNPNTLFNNNDAVLNGTFRTIDYDNDKVAWTVGANYAFTRDLGVFARYSRGVSFPQFDALRSGLTLTQEIDTYEVGVKMSQDLGSLYATAFFNEFTGINNTQILNGATITNVGSAETKGVEVEALVRPFEGLEVGGTVTWLDAQYTNFFVAGTIDAAGNQVQRQPEWQARGTAAYSADTPVGLLTVYGVAAWVDERFSDILNRQPLPSYSKVDAGLTLNPTERLRLQVHADNLFDSHGLTEGNPRSLDTPGGGVILARPILGRSVTFSVQLSF